MPYRSKAQMRKFFAMERRGQLPKGTALEWAHHTKSIKSLPQHVKKSYPVGPGGRDVGPSSFIDRAVSLWIAKQASNRAGGPPDYRPAPMSDTKCRTCRSYVGNELEGKCQMYHQAVDPSYTCSSWQSASNGIFQRELPLRDKMSAASPVQPIAQQALQPRPNAAAGIKPPAPQPLVPPTSQQVGIGQANSIHNGIQQAVSPNPVPHGQLPPSSYHDLATKQAFLGPGGQHLMAQQAGMWPQGFFPPQQAGMWPQQFQQQVPGGQMSAFGLAAMRPQPQQQQFQQVDVDNQLEHLQDQIAYLQTIANQYPPGHPYGQEARNRLQVAVQHRARLQAVQQSRIERAQQQQEQARRQQAQFERVNPNPFQQPAQPAQPARPQPTQQEQERYRYFQDAERAWRDFQSGREQDDRQAHAAQLGDNVRLAELQRTNPQLFEQLRDYWTRYETGRQRMNTGNPQVQDQIPQNVNAVWQQAQQGTIGQLAGRRPGSTWLGGLRAQHEQNFKPAQQIAAEQNPAWAAATAQQRRAILASSQPAPLTEGQLQSSPRFATMPPDQQARLLNFHRNQEAWNNWRNYYHQRYGPPAPSTQNTRLPPVPQTTGQPANPQPAQPATQPAMPARPAPSPFQATTTGGIGPMGQPAAPVLPPSRPGVPGPAAPANQIKTTPQHVAAMGTDEKIMG